MKSKYYLRSQPQGSQEMKIDGLDAVVYAGPGLVAKGYKGKADKPSFHYSFRSQEQMNQHISGFFRQVKEAQERKVQKRAEKKEFKTTLKVGDILYSSWGYDQTNIDFYQVVEVTPTGKSVKIREVAQESKGSSMSMQGTCIPVPGSFISEAMQKKVQPGNYISLTSYSSASMWDGNPKSWSSYA